MVPKVKSFMLTYRQLTYFVEFEDGTSLVLKLGYALDDDFDTDYTIIWQDSKNQTTETPAWAEGFGGAKLERLFVGEDSY